LDFFHEGLSVDEGAFLARLDVALSNESTLYNFFYCACTMNQATTATIG
jgi:hypothetical protein